MPPIAPIPCFLCAGTAYHVTIGGQVGYRCTSCGWFGDPPAEPQRGSGQSGSGLIPAQGCGASPARAATLGSLPVASSNPEGVAQLTPHILVCDYADGPTAERIRAVLELVLLERLRQNALVESGDLPFNCADKTIGMMRKLPVLGEEYGEVSKALYELDLSVRIPASPGLPEKCAKHLRTELIRLAAVATAWAETIA